MEKKAQEYLKKHPDLKKLYGTADGFLFEQRQHAGAHAQSLDDKEVKTFVLKDQEVKIDRAFLMERYEALSGEKAPQNIGNGTLVEKVAELETAQLGGGNERREE